MINYTALAIIGVPIYVLCLTVTIFSVQTNRSISILKDKSKERDIAIIINDFFLLLIAAALTEDMKVAGSFFIWPLVAFGIFSETLFQIPNCLSSIWHWIFRSIAFIGLILELVMHINGSW